MTEKMVSSHGTGYLWQGIPVCNFFKLKMINNNSNDNDNDNRK